MSTGGKWSYSPVLLCYWIVLTNSVLTLRSAAQALGKSSYVDVKDKIAELQCYAKCDASAKDQHSLTQSQCLEQCRNELLKQARRGHCPRTNSEIYENDIAPLQRLSCLYACQYDFDCPEVKKCCDSTCGATVCTEALDLADDKLLPPIPQISGFKLPRGHKVEITLIHGWSGNATYYTHVESRSHFGVLFSPRKFGAWQWQPVVKLGETPDSRSKRIHVGFNVKPSRWYQVRVAAINSYGFRGYSEPSASFSLSNHPKPPKAPANMTIERVHSDGEFSSVRIIWCASKSNLPIEKYKIIWSLYIQKSSDQSFISNQAYVKDTHQFLINNLLPDSTYYIQVQAIAISGNRRLKSEKCSRIYNVTTETTVPYEPLKCSTQPNFWTRQRNDENESDGYGVPHTTNTFSTTISTADTKNGSSHVDTYDVRYRVNRKVGMIVMISGFQPNKERIYELCSKETNCEKREYNAIRAKRKVLEFKLKYNTTYLLKAYGNSSALAATPYTFTTPKCENFHKRFPKMQIKC